MGAQHGFLGHSLGLSQWNSEDLRQEPPKDGRTLGKGQGLLSDMATCSQRSEDWGERLTHVLSF